MKQLIKDQNGAGHLVLILVFVVAFAAIVGLAYTRISDKQDSNETASTSQSEENDEDTPEDKAADAEADDNGDPDDTEQVAEVAEEGTTN